MANTEIKKTQREMYGEIIDILNEYEYEDVKHLIELMNKKIEQVDTKAEKAKAKAAEKKEKADELRDLIEGVLTDEFMTINEITEIVNDPDVSTHKVAPRLKALVEAGIAVKGEVKVSGGEGSKARKLVAYKLASEDAE